MQNAVNIEKLNRKLLLLGIRDNLLGADYIRQAVLIWRPGMSVTKEVYPAIAKLFSSTPGRVERAMRHAIETGWTRCDEYDRTAIFGGTISPDKGKPTNGEFVARLAKVCAE